MPKVKYTYQDVGNPDSRFSECEILPPGMDIALRGKQMVMLWNEKADANGTPERELVGAEIADPFIHEHVWIVRIGRKTTGRLEYLYCQHCPCTGTRILDGHVTLDLPWNPDRNEYCHEKKPVPKKPTFK